MNERELRKLSFDYIDSVQEKLNILKEELEIGKRKELSCYFIIRDLQLLNGILAEPTDDERY